MATTLEPPVAVMAEAGAAPPSPARVDADGIAVGNPWVVAISVMLATFMEVLDTSIASVALPYIAGTLAASNSEATWVLTSYLIANAVILPASNWFSQRFGRKRFLITCVVLFTISSFFCGAAPSLGFLLLARVLQGAGGGALQPISQAVLMESFPPSGAARPWLSSDSAWSSRPSSVPPSAAGSPIPSAGVTRSTSTSPSACSRSS